MMFCYDGAETWLPNGYQDRTGIINERFVSGSQGPQARWT